MKILLLDETAEDINLEDYKKHPFDRLLLFSDIKDSFANFRLDPENDYLAVGRVWFDQIKSNYHLGVRKPNWFDIRRIESIGLNDGTRITFRDTHPTDEDFEKFFHHDYRPIVPLPTRYYINNYAKAKEWLDYFIGLPGELFGFDYETNGFPFVKATRSRGFSISTMDYAIYFDMDSIFFEGTQPQFLEVFNKFLKEKQTSIWVYNVNFEQKISYSYFHEFYDFFDAASINIIEGFNDFRRTLKFTAQRILRVNSWDDEFDFLTDELTYFFRWVENKPVHTCYEELIADPTDSVRWNLMIAKYPKYEAEFISYVKTRWGNPFDCVPNEILGSYCNLDAYYTLLIAKYEVENYSYECVLTYNDNLRLDSRLNMAGIYKDRQAHSDMEKTSNMMTSHAISFPILNYLTAKEAEYADKVIDMNTLNPAVRKAIELNVLEFGDYKVTAKNIANHYYDQEYELGYNDNQLRSDFGEDICNKFQEVVVEEVTKFEKTSLRKVRLWNTLSDYLAEIMNVSEAQTQGIKDTLTHKDYEVKLNRVLAFREARGTLYDVKETYILDEREFTLAQIDSHLFATTVNLQSPAVYDNVSNMFHKQYMPYILFLLAHGHGNKDFGTIFGMPDDINEVDKRLPQVFPTIMSMNNPDILAKMKLMMESAFTDVIDYAWLRPHRLLKEHYPLMYREYLDYYESDRFGEIKFFDGLKMLQAMVTNKKYNKIRGTYLHGMLANDDKWVNAVDENMISTLHDGDKDHIQMYPRFFPCEKSTKRWACGLHTIPSKSEVKRVIAAPPGHLLTYYDISQAEPRAIAYLSQDPEMVDSYENGNDLYVKLAKEVLSERNIDWDDPEEYSYNRSVFKPMVLGKFYRMSDYTMMDQTGEPLELCRKASDSLFKLFHVAKSWADDKSEYPLIHKRGYVDTILGDILKVWIDAPAKAKRDAINWCIQNFAAVTLASGFYNIIRTAPKYGVKIQPNIVVHDSCTNVFDTPSMKKILPYFHAELSDWLMDIHGVRNEFDVLVGTNYYDMAEYSVDKEDPGLFTLKGSAKSIEQVFERFEESNMKIDILNEVNLERSVSPPLHEIFTTKATAIFDQDDSFHKVIFRYAS